MRSIRHVLIWSAILALFYCEPGDSKSKRFSAEDLMAHIQALSSDEFGGRSPGSKGEQKTVAYLVERFKSLGLSPGNPNGTYVQQVPLVGITGNPLKTSITLTHDRNAEELNVGEDYVVWTKRVVESVDASGELVFVGYGVVAPEYGWDDYKDVDVTDKVLLMLVNDPPGVDHFGGDAMTYYGRWTYKYEIAAAKGALGAFIVHETVPAGYPWDVVTGSWVGEQFDLQTADNNMEKVGFEGWFSLDRARALTEIAGLDFDELKQSAKMSEFQPVPLGIRTTVNIENKFRNIDSVNVVARLKGSEVPEETILYLAHWDHLGTLSHLPGDNIFNGAFDNATGTAGLLGLAEAFKALKQSPRRSIVFLAVTAEEQGLLGSRYYAENSLYPPSQTVAAINMDGMNIWGRTKDITVVGMGQSALDVLAKEVADRQGRIIVADPEPEKGYYYRSDHFELAKVGIPSFYPDSGIDFIDKPLGWGKEARAKYVAEDYHKPSDEVKDWYELSGMVEDLEMYFDMGHRLAKGSNWPQWNESSEFRAARQASRQ